MRQITYEIKQAFELRVSKTINNTRTDGQSVWLHGNRIIHRDELGEIWVTLSNWPTPTTRERINGIAPHVSIWQRNHVQYISGIRHQPEVQIELDDSIWINTITGQQKQTIN